MPYPNLTRLLTPYGHFSLQDVLWAQVGASPVFGVLTGIVELAIAVLLFVPRLTLLGALASLIATSFVFMLNMTYDIAVKLFSFHLVLMSLVLLGPDLRRLLNVLVLNRPTAPAVNPPLVKGESHVASSCVHNLPSEHGSSGRISTATLRCIERVAHTRRSHRCTAFGTWRQ